MLCSLYLCLLYLLSFLAFYLPFSHMLSSCSQWEMGCGGLSDLHSTMKPICLRRAWGNEAISPGWDWPSAAGMWKAHVMGLTTTLNCHSQPLVPQKKSWRLRQVGTMRSRGLALPSQS